MEVIMMTRDEVKQLLTEILDSRLNTAPASGPTEREIVNIDTLCERLDITRSTALRWRKKKKIPSFRIGSAVRFDFAKVLDSLQK